MSATNRWKRIVAVQHAFWKRRSLEYLTTLQEKAKWKTLYKNLKAGALVLIAKDNIPPGQWALGRIAEIHPGADGAVRVVTVRLKSGHFKRNVHKLCSLPLDEDEEDLLEELPRPGVCLRHKRVL